jgi:hypothetical protein
MKRIL